MALASLGNLQNVNAIDCDRPLTFGSAGLTVIYGDNASGKSGYARILKSVTGARHTEEILGNAFVDGSGTAQKAELAFTVAGNTSLHEWPSGSATTVQAIHFYDEACGEVYLTGESELTYRPSVLVMLDDLATVCGAVREVIDRSLQANEQARKPLPQVPDGTDAARLLARLNGSMLESEIDSVAVLPPDANEQLAALMQEEVRLRASDPSREQARLNALAGTFERLGKHLATIEKALALQSPGDAAKTRRRSSELRAAASVASSRTFDAEPVRGVGTETWRALWEAAKNFSQAEAYCDHPFPVTNDGRCVLCHQELSEDAADRLRRFQEFMQDTTEQQARVAERDLTALQQRVERLDITPAVVATDVVEIEAVDRARANAVTEWLRNAERYRGAIQAVLDGSEPTDTALPDRSLMADLEAAGTDLRAKAAAIDATRFNADVQDVIARKQELEGRIALANNRPVLTAEISRRAERAKIVQAQQAVDTGTITRKATELTRTYVNDVVKDRFTRESERLRLERITLRDAGGRKGKVRHRPAILSTTSSHPVKKILSEGEQTALGLAGYFTEAVFDESKSGMVLDDPITSLDHARRKYVARRLAEFARERQVIVFTHDVSFAGDLKQEAEHQQATFTERSIQRRGDRPGFTTDEHPWNAKDVGTRLEHLEQELARIKRERANWTQDEYDEACASWGGKLSATWERIVSVEIVGPVVDRGTQQVRPSLFRIFASITDADNREFQHGYGRGSEWARRHDKSPETNYVAPDPQEMAEALTAIRTWFGRIKKYKT